MARRITEGNELEKLRVNQEQLVVALQKAFDLLEDYAPVWYTRKYRDLLTTALARVEGREPCSPTKVDEDFSNKRKRYARSGK